MSQEEQIKQRIVELKAGWADLRSEADALEIRLEQAKNAMAANAGAIHELQKLLPADTLTDS